MSIDFVSFELINSSNVIADDPFYFNPQKVSYVRLWSTNTTLFKPRRKGQRQWRRTKLSGVTTSIISIDGKEFLVLGDVNRVMNILKNPR